MKVLQRYFVSEILRSVLFVLVAFLALFAFFDLMQEIKSIGRGGYRLQHAFLYLLLNLPGYVYELMPTSALIGTIWTLSQFASRSEFTIMRASGLSTMMACRMLGKIGLILVVITFVMGEVIVPMTSELAKKSRLQAQGRTISQEFRSGLWAKDVIREHGMSGAPVGSRFLNVSQVTPDGQLNGVKLYEFDLEFQLKSIVTSQSANYQGRNVWRLNDVVETVFSTKASDMSAKVSSAATPTRDLVSEITPAILAVLFIDPDRMSAKGLAAYTKHLEQNNQSTERYEIAFWKKLVYPFAVLVMMALALPFAYLHVRSGGVSLKIFVGVMIGVSFQLLNSLFSHLGLLHTWPALGTALLPSVIFLLIAIVALVWVQKH